VNLLLRAERPAAPARRPEGDLPRTTRGTLRDRRSTGSNLALELATKSLGQTTSTPPAGDHDTAYGRGTCQPRGGAPVTSSNSQRDHFRLTRRGGPPTRASDPWKPLHRAGHLRAGSGNPRRTSRCTSSYMAGHRPPAQGPADRHRRSPAFFVKYGRQTPGPRCAASSTRTRAAAARRSSRRYTGRARGGPGDVFTAQQPRSGSLEVGLLDLG